jgi:hypothetical protein
MADEEKDQTHKEVKPAEKAKPGPSDTRGSAEHGFRFALQRNEQRLDESPIWISLGRVQASAEGKSRNQSRKKINSACAINSL